MVDQKPDMKADLKEAEDRGEAVTFMEPMMVRQNTKAREELADLALDLTARSTGFRRSLPDGVVRSLGTLVRAMNCYYSNLIEGHDTHPVDIERALANDYSRDQEKRDLQLEAKAHIAVQAWIDEDGLGGKPTASDSLSEIHRRFCERLPEDLLWVEDPETGKRLKIVPGELRKNHVKVGGRIPVSPGAVPRFMRRFGDAYAKLGRVEAIVAAATAHHRLLWMHPFLDGNGRVARLMSYAMLREELDTGGLWSIARGLARSEARHKQHLIACDLPRRNDLDGRGNLSEEALAEFAKFFLETCVDQVKFMERLVQPDRLRNRMLIWAEEEIRAGNLPPNSGVILEAVLYRGELPRGDAEKLLGVSPRHARRVTSALVERGVLISDSTRSPLRLTFPATLAPRWMPGLFPEKT